MTLFAENVGSIMEDLTVDVMSPEDLGDWVSLNLDYLPEDEKRVIVTLMMVVGSFYDFMAENPGILTKYEAYNEQNEITH